LPSSRISGRSRAGVYDEAGESFPVQFASAGALPRHIGAGENTASLAWGDDYFQSLYITAQTLGLPPEEKVVGQSTDPRCGSEYVSGIGMSAKSLSET
jgi:hypothetical protein